ncbi:hypothetical protein ACOI1C_12575 [Bacillus sp. DJP31]|uniref:hypothetical protein n=1 Tax=Bacillus sp. DJP31 TaxID=3409789 RepID=UPI003BB7CD45
MIKRVSGLMQDEDLSKSDDKLTTGIPRWVKVFGVIAVILALLVVTMMFTGEHGPGRHLPSDDPTTTEGGN